MTDLLTGDAQRRRGNFRLRAVFSDSELEEEAVIETFRTTATDGKASP